MSNHAKERKPCQNTEEHAPHGWATDEKKYFGNHVLPVFAYCEGVGEIPDTINALPYLERVAMALRSFQTMSNSQILTAIDGIIMDFETDNMWAGKEPIGFH